MVGEDHDERWLPGPARKSARHVPWGGAAAGRIYVYACIAKLSDDELSRMKRALQTVRSPAGHSALLPDEATSIRGGADQIETGVELRWREASSEEHTHKAAWNSSEEKEVPGDLAAIADVMMVKI